MELKEILKNTIEKISNQNKSDYKKIWILFFLSIGTAILTFFSWPVLLTSILFVVIATLSLKMLLRIKECGRLKNKLISLMNDLEH